MPKGHFKAINFDLDINKLKEAYLGRHYTKAYSDIKKFLKSNGFSHRQGSGYTSKMKLTNPQILDVTVRLLVEYPKLNGCFNKFDVTNIGESYDLLSLTGAENIGLSISQPPPTNLDTLDTIEAYQAEIARIKASKEKQPAVAHHPHREEIPKSNKHER